MAVTPPFCAVDQAGTLEGDYVAVDVPELAIERAGQGAHRRFRMTVEIAKQALTIGGEDGRQAFQAFRANHVSRHSVFAAFGDLSGSSESFVIGFSATLTLLIPHCVALKQGAHGE